MGTHITMRQPGRKGCVTRRFGDPARDYSSSDWWLRAYTNRGRWGCGLRMP